MQLGAFAQQAVECRNPNQNAPLRLITLPHPEFVASQAAIEPNAGSEIGSKELSCRATEQSEPTLVASATSSPGPSRAAIRKQPAVWRKLNLLQRSQLKRACRNAHHRADPS
jgi:hypothetical protein